MKRLLVFTISTFFAYMMQHFLPLGLDYIDNIPKLPVILGMKPRYYIALLLFILLYEYYNRLRGKGYLVDILNSRIEEMKSKALSKCFIEFVTQDSDDIAKLFKLITVQPIDLAWEPQMIGLKSCRRDECPNWNYDNMTKSLSTLRRKRMIFISTSLINWRINMCFAMECHLFEIISNKEKFENDNEYRDLQISKLKSGIGSYHLIKPDCRRIVVIHQEEWQNILNDRKLLPLLDTYFKWHVNNHWALKLYIVDNDVKFKLSVFGNMIRNCDDLTDFIIIGSCNNENIVFAQNNKEMAQIIKNNTSDEYIKWYGRAWCRLHCNVKESHLITNDNIDNLLKKI